jgi:hypothetical protein
MVKTVATKIKDYLLDPVDGIAWADRVAGLVQTAERPIMVMEGGKQLQIGVDSFPIASDVEGLRCWERNMYYALLPGHLYKSVIYFEETSATVFAGYKDPKQNFMVFTGTLRLVCWLNCKQFGVDKPGISDRLMLEIILRLQGNRATNKGQTLRKGTRIDVIDETYNGAAIEFEVLGKPITDRSIFGRYSLFEYTESLIYPFEFFALDLGFRFEVGKNCVVKLDEIDPIC